MSVVPNVVGKDSMEAQNGTSGIPSTNSAESVGGAGDSAPLVHISDSVDSVLALRFEEWLSDLECASVRVVNNSDSEAVHDLRVALRRIRSLLKVVRGVYDRQSVESVRGELKRVAEVTDALRDEEALVETMFELELDANCRSAVSRWISGRSGTKRSLRDGVVNLLVGGVLDGPRDRIRALLVRSSTLCRVVDAQCFALCAVMKAESRVDALRSADVADVSGMHSLRIAYKQLRYVVEALWSILSPERRMIAGVASAFQKVLGNMHDCDVAIGVVREASGLNKKTRQAVLEALEARRSRYARQYCRAVLVGV